MKKVVRFKISYKYGSRFSFTPIDQENFNDKIPLKNSTEYASEEKKDEYIKYFIGEIVLVEIGILIALHLPARETMADQASINNWNEKRKEHILDAKFLHNLCKEIELDTLRNIQLIKWFDGVNQGLKKMIELIYEQSDLSEEDLKTRRSSLFALDQLSHMYKKIDIA